MTTPNFWSPASRPTRRPPDTWWSALRWRIALWFVYRGVALAPDGDAAVALEDVLREWGAMCRVQWALRYPDEGLGE